MKSTALLPARFHQLLSLTATAALFAAAIRADAASVVNWPQFRGPDAAGLSDEPLPVTWNTETGENVRWQTPIPGLGHASPIIWGDHIFIATVVKPGAKADLKVGLYGDIGSYSEKEPHQWRLLCLDKNDGKILWDNLVVEAVPRIQRHTKATHCNSTPATDGKRIVELFGSEGLYCFDMKGKELWHQDLGSLDAGYYVMKDTHWGFASSPVLHDGKIILQCDVANQQYLAVLDASDGKEIWRTPRKDVPSWSTPLVATINGHTEIIVGGWKHIGAYDFKDGHEIWWLAGGGDIPVASPIRAGDFAILTSAHGMQGRPMRAIRLDAEGDINPPDLGSTNAAIAWAHARKGVYLQTPIAVGDLVFGNGDGVVTCFDAKTGKINYEERIGGGGQGFTASPVAANGKIYYAGEKGEVFVMPATREFSVLATNSLGGICLASPAISEKTIYFRTTEKLVAIGFKK
jgi:outer membrane protein assembly factor BamB